jgi:hypothetical protein
MSKKKRTIEKNKNAFKAWINKETQEDNILEKILD